MLLSSNTEGRNRICFIWSFVPLFPNSLQFTMSSVETLARRKKNVFADWNIEAVLTQKVNHFFHHLLLLLLNFSCINSKILVYSNQISATFTRGCKSNPIFFFQNATSVSTGMCFRNPTKIYCWSARHFSIALKNKSCCQMVVPAFLDERRQRLRHARILHCCTTKNPNYNIHCPSPHSSTQLRPITPVASPSPFTSRLFLCASRPVGSVIRWQWRERPRWKLDTVCLHNARQRFCGRTFLFLLFFYWLSRRLSGDGWQKV